MHPDDIINLLVQVRGFFRFQNVIKSNETRLKHFLEAWVYQNGFPGMGAGAPCLQGTYKEPCMLAFLAKSTC